MTSFRHETARLILRDWREDDWPCVHELTNTPAVMRWLGGVADAESWAAMRQRFDDYRKQHGHTFWVLERKEDGEHLSGERLGMCGMKRATTAGTQVFRMPEIGWRLREDAWGQGYAKEAASETLNLGFGHFGYEQIIALTVEGNRASWGLMQKLGMQRRAQWDYCDDEWPAEMNPTIVHSITAEQWGNRDNV